MGKILDFVKSWFSFGGQLGTSLGGTPSMLARQSDAGVVVNARTSMQVSAFSACVDILAADIGSLPFYIYQTTDNGRRRATEHPAYRLLHDAPNEDMTSQSWREILMYDVLILGNAYAYLEKDARQNVVGIYPIPAWQVKPFRYEGNLIYIVDTVTQPLTPDQVLHIPGLAWDGIRGKSIIENHFNTLGIAIAADCSAAKFFGSGFQTEGYLTYPGQLAPEAKEALKSMWQDRHAGVHNSHTTPVLAGGLEYKSITISPEEAQFLESRKYTAVEISRLPGLRIPLPFLNELDRATWANISYLGMQYVTYSLRRWLHKIENECNRKLFKEAEKDRYFCEMDVDAFLRSDQKTRDQHHTTMIQWGMSTPAREAAKENMDTEGLSDVPLQPLNMIPAGETTQNEEGEEEDKDNQNSSPPIVLQYARETNQTKEDKRARYRVLIEDAAARCITKERNAVARLAKKHLPDNVSEFETEAAQFVDDHTDTVRNAFRPVVLTYCKNNADHILHNMVQHMKDTSLDALSEATQKEKPDEAVNELLNCWKTRHEFIGNCWATGRYE